ncbi:MAG TPA: vitamin K epoxide reductase family protein [Micromonosporaceae bacterium]
MPERAKLVAAGLAVAGLGISVYLTVEHYTAAVSLACPTSGAVNCERVTSSPQSLVFGIPVALLGVGYFLVMLALVLPAAWRSARPGLRAARIGLGAAGVAFVLYLIYAELFLINAICLWCTAVHAVTVLLFAVIVLVEAAEPGAPGKRPAALDKRPGAPVGKAGRR